MDINSSDENDDVKVLKLKLALSEARNQMLETKLESQELKAQSEISELKTKNQTLTEQIITYTEKLKEAEQKVRPLRGGRITYCDGGRVTFCRQGPIKLANFSRTQDFLSKKSPNAWKSRREESATQKSEEDANYDNMKREIRGLLNKITPSTYEELSNDFCAYKISDHPKLLISCIDMIFDKAVNEPHFFQLYSDLCKKQVTCWDLHNITNRSVNVDADRQAKAERDKTPDGQPQSQPQQKEKSFRNEIIYKCQRTFLATEEYDKKVNELGEKLTMEGMDDNTRTQIEEELEMLRSKEKRRLLSIIKFMGQLYRHQLLVETIIDWCACELIKRYDMTKEEVYIEYNVELIETVGEIYEKRKELVLAQIARQSQQRTGAQLAYGDDMKPEYRLDMVFSHLTTVVKPLVSNRVRFAIMNLEDLRKTNWESAWSDVRQKSKYYWIMKLQEVTDEEVQQHFPHSKQIDIS